MVYAKGETGETGMRTLAWRPILSNLREAHGELKTLYWRLHFLVFGELPKDCPRHDDESYAARCARQEERAPFAEGSLFVSLEHAYHHLNWAWNCRRTPEDRVWHFSARDADRWTKFPNTKDFADLWPSDRTVRGAKDDLGLIGSRKKISLFPLRPEIQEAQRKLNYLCRLVEKERFGEEVVIPPKGMPIDVRAQPLTEKEFAGRLRRIYDRLNTAWNCRRHRHYPKGEWSRCFSSDFATGCHNMWR